MILEFNIFDRIENGQPITRKISIIHEEIRYWQANKEDSLKGDIFVFSLGATIRVVENYETINRMMEIAREEATLRESHLKNSITNQSQEHEEISRSNAESEQKEEIEEEINNNFDISEI